MHQRQHQYEHNWGIAHLYMALDSDSRVPQLHTSLAKAPQRRSSGLTTALLVGPSFTPRPLLASRSCMPKVWNPTPVLHAQ